MGVITSQNHIFAFYYGEEHLLVKSNSFLKNGLKKDEKCYYCFKDLKTKRLIEQIKNKNATAKQLSYLNIKIIINKYLTGGKKALKKELEKLLNQAKAEGYKKIRILNSPLLVREILADEQLIIWEKELDELLIEIDNISVLCQYDVKSIIENKDNLVEKEFLNRTLKAHSTLLNAEEIYQINNKISINI